MTQQPKPKIIRIQNSLEITAFTLFISAALIFVANSIEKLPLVIDSTTPWFLPFWGCTAGFVLLLFIDTLIENNRKPKGEK